MQLCPGFLEETQNAKVQALTGAGRKPILARGWKKLSSLIDDPFRTPIDVAATFDHTLLHELTHAIPGGAETVDSGGGKLGSYGKIIEKPPPSLSSCLPQKNFHPV